MTKESITEMTVRPLGEYGLELGMTRFELLELSNQASERIGGTLDWLTQLIFALLIASFFVANKLSRKQLGFLLAVYSAIFFFQLWIAAGAYIEYYKFSEAAGLTPIDLINIGGVKVDDMAIVLGLWLVMYMGSIWWVFSCRKSQQKELGSPL